MGRDESNIQMRDEDWLLGALCKPRSRSLCNTIFVSSERGQPTFRFLVRAAVVLKCLTRDVRFSRDAVRNELEVDPLSAVVHLWFSHSNLLEGCARLSFAPHRTHP